MIGSTTYSTKRRFAGLWFAAAMVVVLMLFASAFTHAQGGAAPNSASPPEAPASPETPPAAVEVKTSFFTMLTLGGFLMWPLAACSLLGVALIADRLVALRRGTAVPPEFADKLIDSLGASGRDLEAAKKYCTLHDSPMARVILAGIRRAGKGEEAVEVAIEDAGALEVARLRVNFRMLNGVSVVSPMIGLLGTVWGMIQAFQTASSVGLGQGEKLAEGIYVAMVTTLAGLMIAIPVQICYFYFQSRIDDIVSRMNDVSVRFLDTVFATHTADHPIKSAGARTHGPVHPSVPAQAEPTV